MLSVRRGGPGDAASIHQLMSELAGYQGESDGLAVSPTRLAELLARPDVCFLLAEDDGLPVGYISWVQRVHLWSGEDILAVDDVYVTGGTRGQGVGELLMKTAAEHADGRLLRWEVGEHNVRAQRFYERLGATLTTKKVCRWRPTHTAAPGTAATQSLHDTPPR
jgi:ribosomal protein S18 acetylase RimI-like enzyme